MRSDSVQHERKPIVDRKEQHKSPDNDNDSGMMQSKSRLKKEPNDSVNYLSFFQLNPLLMAASNVNNSQAYQASSPVKMLDPASVKMEESELTDNKPTNFESSELYESVLEQKLLNDTFVMINAIETSLQAGYENCSNGNSFDVPPEQFMSNLLDENLVNFNIQIPSLLPKMHFVCEVGSRIIFKSIDWLREVQVWQNFETGAQSEMLKQNWVELLILGLAQVASQSSSQTLHLKSMVVSTLVNYVKSLIICSANDSTQSKAGGNGDMKAAGGQKLKKMLTNIMKINKFMDLAAQMDLNAIEFAHMRILCLLNPNKFEYPSDFKLKSRHQKVIASLQSYLKVREKSQNSAHDRIVAICQASSLLPQLDGKIIEKLFFNILVDFVKINNVIPYILDLNSDADKFRPEVKHEKGLDLSDELHSDDQRYYSGEDK